MAKPNYRFDKRQRELAKKQKQEEKLLKKQARNAAATQEAGTDSPPADTSSVNPTETP